MKWQIVLVLLVVAFFGFVQYSFLSSLLSEAKENALVYAKLLLDDLASTYEELSYPEVGDVNFQKFIETAKSFHKYYDCHVFLVDRTGRLVFTTDGVIEIEKNNFEFEDNSRKYVAYSKLLKNGYVLTVGFPVVAIMGLYYKTLVEGVILGFAFGFITSLYRCAFFEQKQGGR